jgi:hypothetical protein
MLGWFLRALVFIKLTLASQIPSHQINKFKSVLVMRWAIL